MEKSHQAVQPVLPILRTRSTSRYYRHPLFWKNENLPLRLLSLPTLPTLSPLLYLCQPRSHVRLMLFMEVVEEDGTGELLAL
jgi:hypothetical protein